MGRRLLASAAVVLALACTLAASAHGVEPAARAVPASSAGILTLDAGDIDATPDADAVQRAVRREVARLLAEHGWSVQE